MHPQKPLWEECLPAVMYVVPEKKAHGAKATGVIWGALNSKNLCKRGWEERDEFGILNFRPFNIGHASLSFRDGWQ